jgi:hypothetical protein
MCMSMLYEICDAPTERGYFWGYRKYEVSGNFAQNVFSSEPRSARSAKWHSGTTSR